MRWLLDSNVWIEAAAGLPCASRILAQAATIDWCGFSSISRLEVLGFPNMTVTEESALLAILAQFNEIPVSSHVIDRAIQLRRQVKLKVPDAIIAATALVQNAALITRNTADFKHVSVLTVLDPASF